jgi:hypothetical protein
LHAACHAQLRKSLRLTRIVPRRRARRDDTERAGLHDDRPRNAVTHARALDLDYDDDGEPRTLRFNGATFAQDCLAKTSRYKSVGRACQGIPAGIRAREATYLVALDPSFASAC